jgi:hypothetical protein
MLLRELAFFVAVGVGVGVGVIFFSCKNFTLN